MVKNTLSFPSACINIEIESSFLRAVKVLKHAGISTRQLLNIYMTDNDHLSQNVHYTCNTYQGVNFNATLQAMEEAKAYIKGFSPQRFLLQYMDIVDRMPNISGITGYLRESIINTQRQNTKEHLLVLDAPMYFLQSDSDAAKKIIYAYSDPNIVSLLKSDPNLKEYDIQDFSALAGLTIHRILFFGFHSQPHDNLQIITHLVKYCSSNTPVHLLLPDAHWKDTNFKQNLCSVLDPKKFVLFDSKAVRGNPAKWSLSTLFLAAQDDRRDLISFLNLKHAESGCLKGGEFVSIPYQDFLSDPSSLKHLYRKHAAKGESRQKAEEIFFSPEVPLSVTYVTNEHGQVRAFISFRGNKLLDDNSCNMSNNVLVKSGGPWCASQGDARNAAINILFGNSRFAQKVRSLVAQDTIGKPIHFKTLWLLCYPDLSVQDKYNHQLMANVMDQDTPLANLTTENSEDEFAHAVDRCVNQLSTMREPVLRQLHLLLNQAYVQGLCDLSCAYAFRPQKSQDVINRGIIRSRTVDITMSANEEMQFMHTLNAISASPSLKFGIDIEFSTGLSLSQICSLKWEDYQLDPFTNEHYLYIRRKTDDKGDDQPLSTPRRFPICATLNNKLKTLHRIEKTNPTFDEQTAYIIHADNDCTQKVSIQSLRQLRRTCTESINREELLMLVAGITPVETDLYSNPRYLLKHNAYYNFLQQGMSQNECCHLVGNKCITTAAKHYIDYNNPYVQHNMLLKLNRIDQRRDHYDEAKD